MTDGDRLIGRDTEIARLAGALERARDGSPGFWLVTGEAGIGKTRLLGELSGRADAAGVRVAAGTATETGRNVPFLPLLAPLRRVLEHPGDGRSATARDIAAATVSLAINGGAVPVEAGLLDTARLFEAIHDLLVRTPTLLAIDDVHWADDSTIAVLDYLAHRVTHAPLLVVALARDDPAPAGRLPIATGRVFALLPLVRLEREDVRRLAQQIAGRPLDTTQVDGLHRRSAGNPLFVEQLVRGIASSGRADGGRMGDRTGGVHDVPAALRTMLLQRVHDLGASSSPVLEALAVLGGPVPASLVTEVANLPAAQVKACLREATTAGVTVATREGHGFRHPLYGEVVAAELAGPELRSLHARAAVALTGTGDVAAIAEHWWLAGAPEAWASAREAGEAAARAFAFAEARTHLERAIAAWPDGAPGLVEALLGAAHAAWVTGDPQGAVALAERAVSIEPDRPDGALALATYRWDAGRRPEAASAFLRASALLAADRSPERRARGEWAAGRAAVAMGHPREAADHSLRAARQARACGSPGVEADALALTGMALGFDDSLEGIPSLERAAALALELRAPPVVGHTHQFLVDLLGLAGRVDDALRVAAQGVDACDRLGTARTHGSDHRGRLALLLIDRGRWTEADTVLERADARAFPLLAQALLAMRRGSFDAAGILLADAAAAGSIGGPGALGGWLELARVELAWLQGDTPGAATVLDALPRVPGVWGRDVAAWRARWMAQLGPRRAIAAEAGLVAARAHPDPAIAAAITAELRACLTEPGSLDQVTAWGAAVNAWEHATRPWEAAVAALDHAAAWFAARDGRRGREALDRAQSTAAELDAAPLLARIDDLARRARVKVGASRPRTEPDAPTRRELDVLRLVAEGRTNPQIAETLFLSPKTVGIHVSRLLDKLGASTRGEAVAVARRRGLID